MSGNDTLVLNATYEPMGTIAFKRAIVLALEEKVDVLEETEFLWRSGKLELFAPSVIRLRSFQKIPFKVRAPLTRRALIARDNHECQFVGCSRKGTTIDHVHPTSKGGLNEWENVVAACKACNARKADRTLEDLGWSLKRQPRMPMGGSWLVMGMYSRPEWKQYLDVYGES